MSDVDGWLETLKYLKAFANQHPRRVFGAQRFPDGIPVPIYYGGGKRSHPALPQAIMEYNARHYIRQMIVTGDQIPDYSSICCRCMHIGPGSKNCTAFPEGIPMPIWIGENDHTGLYLGDNGIRFELRPALARREAIADMD